MAERSGRTRSVLYMLASVFRGDGKDLAVICAYGAVVGICSLAVPIGVQAIVTSVAMASVVQPIVVLTCFVAAVLAFAGIMRLLQAWVAETLQRRLTVRCSIALAQQLPRVAVRPFSRDYGADYVVRYMELFNVQKLVTLILLDGTAVFFQIFAGLALVSFYHPYFLAFALVLLLLIGVIVFGLGLGGVVTSEDESEAKYGIMSWLQALSHHPETFKSSHGARFAVARMDDLVTTYLERRAKHFRVLVRQNVASVLLQASVNALLLGLGAWLVIEGQLTLGQLVAAELVFGLVLVSVTKLGKHLEKFYDISASVIKLDSLFNLPREEPTGVFFDDSRRAAKLVLRGVTISFPGMSKPLLHDVNLELLPGEKAVLWGPNGSGKSVLADVIYRFAEPALGRAELDDHPVSAIHPLELRSKIALIRGPELFPGTVEENLLLGRTDIPRQELRRMLNLVGLSERVASFREGTNTRIKSSGSPLSSGEALRLTFARALLADPELLVIDGTLDSMDETAQAALLKVIARDLPHLTVLLLTHERSLAKSLPKVFSIESGTVIDSNGGVFDACI
jgi:putative ABC transport system ATP-binding protein